MKSSHRVLVALIIGLGGCSSQDTGREQTVRRSQALAQASSSWIEDQAPTVGWQIASGKTRVVAASRDLLVIGVPDDDAGEGSAYVFERSGAVWTLTARLKGSQQCNGGPCFGTRVAIASDTIFVSEPAARRVNVFTRRDDERWTLTQVISDPSTTQNEQFGVWLAVSNDTMAIGAPSGGADLPVYVFVRDGGVWGLQAKLAVERGSSIALDADTLVVGGQETVHVFMRQGSSWVLEQELVSDKSDNQTMHFGQCLALSGDTLAVTATGQLGQRPAYVFGRDGSTWFLQQRLEAGFTTASQGASFGGCSISLSGDTLLVANNFVDRSSSFVQRPAVVDIFGRIGDTWTEQAHLAGQDPLGDSVSTSGEEAVIADDFVRVFARSGSSWLEQRSLAPSFPTAPIYSIGVSGERLALVTLDPVQEPQQFVNVDIFSRFGTVWLPEQRIQEEAIFELPTIQLFDAGLVVNPRPRVFMRSAAGYSARQELVPRAGAGQFDSANVSDQTAIVSSSDLLPPTIFAYDGASWTEQATLGVFESGTSYEKGIVSGSLALVRTSNGSAEAVFAFSRSGTTWTQDQKLDGLGFDDGMVIAGKTVLMGSSLYEYDGAAWNARRSVPSGFPQRLAENVAFVGPDVTLVKLNGQWQDEEARLPRLRYWGETGSIMFALSDQTLALASTYTVHVFRRHTRSAAGSFCTSATDCASGSCVHGICCDRACTSACETCVSYLTGLSDGTCGQVRAGTRCGPEPLACISRTRYALAPTCDASGTCRENTVSCADGAACTTNGLHGWCATDCGGSGIYDQTLCDDAHWCAPNPSGPSKGICQADLRGGSQCDASEQCISGECTNHWCAAARGEKYSDTVKCAAGLFSVDGYCCDTACNGVCQACNVRGHEGTCTVKLGDPEPGHGSCQGFDPECDGTCDGTDGEQCHFPGSATECAPGSCVGAVQVHPRHCDGAGRCAAADVQNCAPYTCDPDARACKISCNNQKDCVSGALCNSDEGTCTASGPICDGASTVVHPDNSRESCAPFACSSGQCKEVCSHNADCAPGFACASQRCVESSDAGRPIAPSSKGDSDGGACTCESARASAPSRNFGVGSLASLALLMVRRSRRKDSSWENLRERSA